MKKIKLCCFTVNSTHSYIIANNFIDSELENVKVIYINEKSEKSERRKIKNIITKTRCSLAGGGRCVIIS